MINKTDKRYLYGMDFNMYFHIVLKRLEYLTKHSKLNFISVLQGVQKYEIKKNTPLKFKVKILNVIIFDLPTNQQKRVLHPRLITWIINAYLTCNYMTNIFKRSMGNIAHIKKIVIFSMWKRVWPFIHLKNVKSISLKDAHR